MADKEPSKEAVKVLQTANRGEFRDAKADYSKLKADDAAWVREQHPAFGAFVQSGR